MMVRVLIVMTLLLAGCAGQQQKADSVTSGAGDDPVADLQKGAELLGNGSLKKAIDAFDRVIDQCDFGDETRRVYASRSINDTIYYMALAAVAGQEAEAVDSLCSEALYLKGYAKLDMGRVDEAEEYVRKAIDMAPVNAVYLSELGHIYQIKRDMKTALDIFRQAEEAADSFSPDDVNVQELGRAKRGVGYSLIELGELDAAEQKFRECLELNDDDQGARNELKYIDQLRGTAP